MNDEYKIEVNDGEVILKSEKIDLKITSDRVLWRKLPADSTFKSTARKVPKFMKKREKIAWLADLRLKYLQYKGLDVGEPTEYEDDEVNNDIEIEIGDLDR